MNITTGLKKAKAPFSMLLDPAIYNRLHRESKRLKVSKVRIVTIALSQLFKNKKLDIEIN